MRSTPAALFFFALLGSSCGYRDLKADLPPTYTSISQVSIVPNCAGCHQEMRVYSGVMRNVRPGNPSTSRLYTELLRGKMPPTGPALAPQELTAIYQWILDGAPEN